MQYPILGQEHIGQVFPDLIILLFSSLPPMIYLVLHFSFASFQFHVLRDFGTLLYNCSDQLYLLSLLSFSDLLKALLCSQQLVKWDIMLVRLVKVKVPVL